MEPTETTSLLDSESRKPEVGSPYVISEYPLHPILLSLFAAIVAGGIGIYAGNPILDSDYVADGSDWSQWSTSGYTGNQLFWYIMHIFLFPIGALFTWYFAYHSYKAKTISVTFKFIMYFGATAGFIVLLIWNAETYPTDKLLTYSVWFAIFAHRAESNIDSGFRDFLALLYLTVCSIFILIFSILTTRTAWELLTVQAEQKGELEENLSLKHEVGSDMQVEVDLVPKHKSALKKVTLYWVVFLVKFPIIVLLCMSLPCFWPYFTVYHVQDYARIFIDNEYGTVWNFFVAPPLTLKLYPDILMFYSFIYAIAFFGFLTHASSTWKRWMHSRPKMFRGVCIGEILMVILFVALMGGLLYYWYFVHYFNDETSYTWSEQLARVMGQLGNCVLGLQLLPVSRNSIWSETFGTSWEYMMKFHRRLGRLFLIIVVAHVVIWVIAEGWAILAFPRPDYHTDDFLVPMMIPVAAFMLLFMGVFTLDRIRRKHFEVFYYAHHFAWVVYLAVLWHAPSSWYYLLGGLALYVLDRVIRFTQGLSTVTCVGVKCFGKDVTRISYLIESGGKGPYAGEKTRMKFSMGQYCFINIPAISMNEWHPYTISCAPSDKVMTHNIKSFGENTFGGKLFKLASSLPWDTFLEDLTINVDGPYGVQPDFYQYKHVTFIMGGIGITPGISCFREMFLQTTSSDSTSDKLERCELLWSTRGAHDYKMFEDTFRRVNEVDGVDGKFTYKIHVCGGEDEDATVYGDELDPIAQSVVFAMMDLEGACKKIKETGVSPEEVLLFVCGPPGLAKFVEKLSMDYGYDFHMETFIL